MICYEILDSYSIHASNLDKTKFLGKLPVNHTDPVEYEEFKDAPTIFVGAAHCNYICKDVTDPEKPVTVETCCCRKASQTNSCKVSC